MSNKIYTITEQTVRSAIDYIETNPAFSHESKPVFKNLITLLCGIKPRIYKPGETIYMTKRPFSEPSQRYLICVTGDYKGKLSIRFCNTTTGMKAGDKNKTAYQLEEGAEGIKISQIEEYFSHEYKVVIS